MATTVVAPGSFDQAQSDLGFAYVFAQEQIRQEINEKVEVLGMMPLLGDLVGTGSDVVRLTRFGGVGFAEQMTAMTSETEGIIPTGWTTDFDTATIARYGLSKEETYQGTILNRAEGVNLDNLVALVPASVQKTLRVLMLTSATGITNVQGTTATAWTFDDEINLVTYFNEIEGFEGMVDTWRQPEQFSDLAASLRNEPAYQEPGVMSSIQGLKPNGAAFSFLGFENHASHDVQASGGDHIGAAFVRGAIGWVRASTMPLQGRVRDPSRAIFVPDLGLVIEWDSASNSATAKFVANAWFGTTLLDSSLFPQSRIRSIND